MNEIEARLARLERRNRIYRGLLTLMLVGLAAALFGGAGEPVADVIRARQIELVDEKGNVTARLESDFSGGLVRLLGIDGTERLTLSTTPAGALLDMKSPSGKSLVTVSAGFLAGMVRVDAGMVKVASMRDGATVILGDTVRQVEE